MSEPIGDIGPKEGCAVSPHRCQDNEIRRCVGGEREEEEEKEEKEKYEEKEEVHLMVLDVSCLLSQCPF